MKIEKLRNNHKKEIIIGTILTVVIGGALTFKLTHSKYRSTQSIDLATGVINYTVPDFKIMAMYKNDGSGDVSIDSMPTDGYVINTSKSYCDLNGSKDNNVVIENVNGKPLFSGLNKGDKCYLYFDKGKTIDNIIAGLNAKADTPDFSQTATTDEGVYATSDGTNMYSGTTYYWRGAATTNHVIFANKCWRIVRINGDKTMRLIYNGTIQANNTCFGNGSNADSIAVSDVYYATSDGKANKPYYAGWTYIDGQRPTLSLDETGLSIGGTESYIKIKTEEWYDNNIGNNSAYSSKVANGKFCNDRTLSSNSSWTDSTLAYASGKRISDSTPTFSCESGDVYTLKVGAITADEALYAGGKRGIANESYYLYTGKNYWTMTPSSWDGEMEFVLFMYILRFDGYIWIVRANTQQGLRPVINLKSDTIFSSGNGEQNSPYIVAN